MSGKHSFGLALLPVAVAFASYSAFVNAAEDNATQLTNVVISAAGYEQKLVEAPASISVITAEELRSKPYSSLLDAVRELEGVDIGETRDKTGQGTISMRGMGSDYTLILIDGKRQNNHGNIYPNNFGGNQFKNIPPIDAIERIEVIRGPASTLYGSDALGGVINIITKAVGDTWAGSVTHSRTVQSDSNYGNDITTDFYMSGPIVVKQLGLAVRGSMYNLLETNPEYAPIKDPNGVQHSRAQTFGGGGRTVDNENYAVGASLKWTPTDNQKMTFDIDTYNQKYDNSQGQLGTLDGMASVWRPISGWCEGFTPSSGGNQENKCITGSGTWHKRVDPRVGYAADQEFTRDTMALTHEGKWDFGHSFISLSHVSTNNNGRTMPFTVAERNQLLEMQEGTGAYTGMSEADRKALAEATFLPRKQRTMESEQYVLDAKIDMPFELAGQHTAIVGGQVIRGKLNDGIFGMEQGAVGKAQDHNMWSVFAEDTWYIVQPFALTAGVRYDNHEVFGDHVSPRLYGVYSINHNWTVKGGMSTGFKTPNTTDLYDGITGFGGQGTLPLFGNPDLKPETSTSSELAVYWQGDDGYGVNATLFQNKFKDKISSQPCGPTTSYSCASAREYQNLGYASSSKSVNIDEVVLEGVELAGRVQILDDWSLRANYTFTDSEQKSGVNEGKPYGNVAKHMANATLDWQALEDFGMFLTVEARDKRYRSWDAVKDKALYYKGYEVLHLGFSYKASKNVTFNGRINNLLDLDFTSYETEFADDGSGNYTATYIDDFNNKDKRRNYWLSMNVTF